MTANEIDLTTPNSVIGTGNITLRPFTLGQNIALGGAADTGATTLDLTATDLAAFKNGFSAITIGRSDGTGTISVNNNITFNAPVILANSTDLNSNADITNQNRSIIFQKPVSLIKDVTVKAGNGDISFNSTVDGDNVLTLNAGNNIDFGGAVGGATPLNNLNITTPATKINVGANITTANAQIFNNPITLTGNANITAKTGTPLY